jgi:hypothetical protein
VKQKKATRNKSKGQSKDTTKNWKNKAILRRKEIERLNKRNKELIISRNGWKEKYKNQQKDFGVSSVSTSNLEKRKGGKAYGHQYNLRLIILVVELYKYGGMSLRSCRHSLSCIFVCLGLDSRIPSHNSIRNWICKCGIHRVNNCTSSREDHMIIVDESITFGSEKMLLILGIPPSKMSKEKSLSHSDMSVLYVGASKEWKGEDIKAEIEKIRKHKKIRYVVSDEGSNLRKAYKLLNLSHIEDCTHIMANYLKRIYGNDADFETFRKLIGKLRRDWNLSKTKSKYMPPTMRGKMRFANIFPCISWAKKTLDGWDDLSEEVQGSLSFLKEKTDFISSLIEVEIIFKLVCKKLKNKGFGKIQKQEILKELSGMEVREKSSVFIKNCKSYLDNLTIKSELLKEDHLLCSSDIIESYFGKFKFKVNPNSRSGLTEFIFTVATFGQSFSEQEAKQAMESIKCKDLKLYRNKTRAA